MAGGNKGGSENCKLKGDLITLPVAATTEIFRGTFVALNATGGLVQAGDTTGLTFAGVAEEHVNNTGALGALTCRVRRRGIFRAYKNGVNAATDVGRIIYAFTAHGTATDEDVEVLGTASVIGACPIGICTAVEATIGTSHYLWVDIDTTGALKKGTRPVLSKTGALYAATAGDVVSDAFIYMATAHEVTLPAATAAMAGHSVVVAAGAAATVKVAAGFGAAGGGADTVTLADGQAVTCYCNGAEWFYSWQAAAAA